MNETNNTELDRVQRQLDSLVKRRSMAGFTVDEAACYWELCRRERALLATACRSPGASGGPGRTRPMASR